MNLLENCLIPDWPAPNNVRTLQTTRNGGTSAAPYASFNLGDHVGDVPLAVERNRMLLQPLLPSEPVWLKQVHGTVVADAGNAACWPQADACITSHPGAVCVVMTADCLPVLLCDDQGSVVGAAHAGWRGLCDGVIEQTVRAMNVPPQNLMAWLGRSKWVKKFVRHSWRSSRKRRLPLCPGTKTNGSQIFTSSQACAWAPWVLRVFTVVAYAPMRIKSDFFPTVATGQRAGWERLSG